LTGAVAFYIYMGRTLPNQVAPLLLLILALNSFAFSSFVGNTGYLDALLLALTVLALSSDAKTNRGLALRLGLSVLGVLIHENMLPYFTILIGFDIWLARRGAKGALAVSLTPSLAAALMVLILAVLTPMTAQQATAFAAHLQSKAGFALDPTSTVVAGRSIGQNFALMADLHKTTKYWGWVLFDGVPLAMMALWLLWLARRVLGPQTRPLTQLYLAGAIFAPLSLNLIAFDVVRFGTASVLSGFIAIALVMRHVPGAPRRLHDTLTWPLFLLLLVINANMFTIEVNIGAGQTSQFPWVLLTQLKWFSF